MPSVALVVPFEIMGAAEDYAFLLAEGLLERRWPVTVICSMENASRERVRVLARGGADVRALPAERMNSSIGMRRTLREVTADIVHVNHAFLPPLVGARFLQRKRIVATVHAASHRPHYSWRGNALRRIATPIVDCWIVLSERNAELLRTRPGFRAKRVEVVSPGLPEIRFLKVSRDDARALLGVPPGAFVVGAVARLSQEKRLDLLIDAICLLARQDVHLVIAGEGPLRDQLESRARGLGERVHFLGHREDVSVLLQGFDVFCLPSDREGLSFALLEAMAVGLAIVATDVQGSGEAIIDGESGLLVPPGSAAAIATALSRLIEHPATARILGESAKKRFAQNFTADQMVERTLRVYESLFRS